MPLGRHETGLVRRVGAGGAARRGGGVAAVEKTASGLFHQPVEAPNRRIDPQENAVLLGPGHSPLDAGKLGELMGQLAQVLGSNAPSHLRSDAPAPFLSLTDSSFHSSLPSRGEPRIV